MEICGHGGTWDHCGQLAALDLLRGIFNKRLMMIAAWGLWLPPFG